MNQSLSHLPEAKQKEILEILEIIKEEAQPERLFYLVAILVIIG
jgi:hypothetical protein